MSDLHLKWNENAQDFILSHKDFARLASLKDRHSVRHLTDKGLVVRSDRKVCLIQSLKRMIDDRAPAIALDPTAEIVDFDKANKREDYRRKKRENDEAIGVLAHRDTFIAYLQEWSKDTGVYLDTIESKISANLPVCKKCNKPTELSGSGREKIREVIIAIRNAMDRLHRNSQG